MGDQTDSLAFLFTECVMISGLVYIFAVDFRFQHLLAHLSAIIHESFVILYKGIN